MRGKNILWISLLLVLGIAMLGPVNAPVTNTTIRVLPTSIEGHPGDVFLVTITIEDVTDLYAFGFSLQFAPFGKILIVSNMMDGGFLQPNPFITKKLDLFHGILQVAGTLIGAQPGVSGAGMLFIIEFTVVEAGKSELTLFDTVLLDSSLNPMPHQTRDSFYDGPELELVRVEVLPGRDMHVCQTVTLNPMVKNIGDVDLYARVRFDMIRDDGKLFQFYAGQTAAKAYPEEYSVYLYVNSFSWQRDQWYEVGTDPYLDAPGDGSYIWQDADHSGPQERWFGFEDITLSPGESIKEIRLEGYTDGPYNEGIDFDTYGPGFGWLGSLYAEGYPAWVSPRWTTDLVTDVYPELTGPDATNLNNFEVLEYWYNAAGESVYGAIDCLRLKVTILPMSPITPPVYVVHPNQNLELPPFTWDLGDLTVGTYYTTAYVEFSYYGNLWNLGQRVKTFTWWVDP